MLLLCAIDPFSVPSTTDTSDLTIDGTSTRRHMLLPSHVYTRPLCSNTSGKRYTMCPVSVYKLPTTFELSNAPSSSTTHSSRVPEAIATIAQAPSPAACKRGFSPREDLLEFA